jgi:hypothetical protein
VPYVHGLTIAELARIAKDTPGWMETPEHIRKNGKLTVIPMHGWRRDMLWTETGLPLGAYFTLHPRSLRRTRLRYDWAWRTRRRLLPWHWHPLSLPLTSL